MSERASATFTHEGHFRGNGILRRRRRRRQQQQKQQRGAPCFRQSATLAWRRCRQLQRNLRHRRPSVVRQFFRRTEVRNSLRSSRPPPHSRRAQNKFGSYLSHSTLSAALNFSRVPPKASKIPNSQFPPPTGAFQPYFPLTARPSRA